MAHGDIETIRQNSAEAIAAGHGSLGVSQGVEKHVGKRDRLFHCVRANNPFRSLKN
jgi:hypothetical protein